MFSKLVSEQVTEEENEEDETEESREEVLKKKESELSKSLSKKDEVKGDGHLTEKETIERGFVKTKIYKYYASRVGYLTFLVIICAYTLATASNISANLWLAFWSVDGQEDDAFAPLVYAGVYSG